MIRIAIPMAPIGAQFWLGILAWLALANLLFCGLVAVRQRDLNLLIGNSRWHWAIQKENQWSFLHTSPKPQKLKSLSKSLKLILCNALSFFIFCFSFDFR